MDRFFVKTENIDLDNNGMYIEGDDVKHITNVLRLKPDDTVEVCDGNDNEYICRITECDKKKVSLEVIEKIDIVREPLNKVKAYQGVPKGQKMDLIAQKLTEIGVDEIILVNTDRCVSKIDKKADKKLERWERIIYEAAKQSKRGKVPVIRGPLGFKEAVADMAKNDYNMVPYENERENSIKTFLKNIKRDLDKNEKNNADIGFFIGPEGGFSDEEIELLKEKGITTVTFGNRILRTETAGLYCLSTILYELEMED